MRLTPSLSADSALTFRSERAVPGGSVEIVYSVSSEASRLPGHDATWQPASQQGRP
jgi:hypothetical protein